MKSVKYLWTYAPLNKKIAIIFLFITVGASMVVGLVSYQLSKNVITKSSIDKSQNAAQTVANIIDEFLNNADQTFISIYSNQNLRGYLEEDSTIVVSEFQNAQRVTESLVTQARQLNNAVVYANIFGINGFSFTDYYYHSEENTDFNSCVNYYSPYGLDPDKTSVLWVPNQKVDINFTHARLLTLVRYTRNIYNLKITGIMTMGIMESYLCKQYLSTSNDAFIADTEGTIISHYDKTLIGTTLQYPSICESLTLKEPVGTVIFTNDTDNRLFATYSIIPETGWYLVSIEDYYEIFQNNYYLLGNICLILLLTIILSSIVLVIVSKALTASLRRLYATMKQVMEGNLSVHYKPSGNDEINRIGIYLNDMLDQIRENIRYREESERLARISDLRLLQSQINPHLLYNTLDSVHYNLETANYEKAADTLKSMSAFFKLSLSQGDILIPIERELSLIRVYLDIQRICREKNIELIVTGESPYPVNIPKMTIQPIIENSIMHGFPGNVTNARIAIEIQEIKPGVIAITITDNGVGMTKEQCLQINMNISSPVRGLEQKHYGLWNVNQRLKSTFGNDSGLEIKSEFGVFTRTIIIIHPDARQGGDLHV